MWNKILLLLLTILIICIGFLGKENIILKQQNKESQNKIVLLEAEIEKKNNSIIALQNQSTNLQRENVITINDSDELFNVVKNELIECKKQLEEIPETCNSQKSAVVKKSTSAKNKLNNKKKTINEETMEIRNNIYDRYSK